MEDSFENGQQPMEGSFENRQRLMEDSLENGQRLSEDSLESGQQPVEDSLENGHSQMDLKDAVADEQVRDADSRGVRHDSVSIVDDCLFGQVDASTQSSMQW